MANKWAGYNSQLELSMDNFSLSIMRPYTYIFAGHQQQGALDPLEIRRTGPSNSCHESFQDWCPRGLIPPQLLLPQILTCACMQESVDGFWVCASHSVQLSSKVYDPVRSLCQLLSCLHFMFGNNSLGSDHNHGLDRVVQTFIRSRWSGRIDKTSIELSTDCTAIRVTDQNCFLALVSLKQGNDVLNIGICRVMFIAGSIAPQEKRVSNPVKQRKQETMDNQKNARPVYLSGTSLAPYPHMSIARMCVLKLKYSICFSNCSNCARFPFTRSYEKRRIRSGD